MRVIVLYFVDSSKVHEAEMRLMQLKFEHGKSKLKHSIGE